MNKDYIQRDEIIFGSYKPGRYSGGCARAEIDGKTLLELVKRDFIELDECQNDSPTTKEFIEAFNGVEDYISYEVYAIEHARDDYRVTVEGVNVRMPENMKTRFFKIVSSFGYADEFNVWEDNGILYMRAWWD